MKCSLCGGEVLWMGPLTDLTHTECQQCGAHNSQLPEVQETEDTETKKQESEPTELELLKEILSVLTDMQKALWSLHYGLGQAGKAYYY